MLSGEMSVCESMKTPSPIVQSAQSMCVEGCPPGYVLHKKVESPCIGMLQNKQKIDRLTFDKMWLKSVKQLQSMRRVDRAKKLGSNLYIYQNRYCTGASLIQLNKIPTF